MDAARGLPAGLLLIAGALAALALAARAARALGVIAVVVALAAAQQAGLLPWLTGALPEFATPWP